MGLDSWLWDDESRKTRDEKSVNFLKYRFNDSDNTHLRNFRFFAFGMFVWHEFMNLSEDWTVTWWMAEKMTTWSWYIWGSFLATACLGHLQHDILGKAYPSSDSTSPFALWKVVSVLFEFSCVC